MLARLRTFLLKTPVIVALGLAAAWLLFAWLALGPLLQWGAARYVAGKTAHHLTLERPRFNPFTLELSVRDLRLAEPDGQPLAGFKELYVDFEASSLLRLAWTFDHIRLAGLHGRLVLLPGGRLNWSAFIDAFKNGEEEPEQGLPRLLVRRFELRDGRVDFVDRTVAPAFETGFRPLDLTLDDISTLPDDKGAYQVAARTALGGRLRWHGEAVLKPAVAVTGAFALEGVQLAQLAPYLQGRLAIAAPVGTAGVSTRYRLGYDNKHLSLNLDQIGASVEGLRLRGAQADEPALAVDRLAVSGGRFDLDQRRLDLAAIDLAGGRVNLVRRVDGSLDVQDWLVAAAADDAAASPPPEGQGPGADAGWPGGSGKVEVAGNDGQRPLPWSVELARFGLDGVAIHVLDQGFAKPLAIDIGNLKVGFKAAVQAGTGPLQARLSEGRVELQRVAAAAAGKPLASLDGVALEGIAASLAERHAEAERLAVQGGRLAAERSAAGRIALVDALAPATRAAPRQAAAAAAGPAWTWRLGSAELAGFQVALRDATVKPAAVLDLDAIAASVNGLSQDLKAAVPVALSLRVRQGGSLRVQGKLVPGSGSLDARVDLAGLRLTPAQPYIGEAARVTLVSGVAASRGRLQVGRRIAYRGGFSVSDLLVNEAETGNRLLAWRRLSTAALAASPEAV
ncbi:MAG: DUF748 domain-containing protein, partial [Gallionellaceae bacterium]|nr:DUF748 domain-containing protein [Gallionellaceae bacterium]